LLSGATPISFAASFPVIVPSSETCARSIEETMAPTPGTLRRRASCACQSGCRRIAEAISRSIERIWALRKATVSRTLAAAAPDAVWERFRS